MASTAPTGEQFEVTTEGTRAVIVAQGAGLRRLTLSGVDVVDGYSRQEPVAASRGALLLPWPNRVRDGRYVVEGIEHQLEISEPARGHAIHGLTRFVTGQLRQRGEDHVSLGYELCASPGYPFHLDLAASYRLSANSLTVEIAATNLGDVAAPLGVGAHPYLTLSEPLIDSALLRLPAARRLELDRHLIPTGETVAVAGTGFDFLNPRRLGDLAMDTAFTALQRDPDGLARCHLETADRRRRVTLWLGTGLDHLMVFTGDQLAQRPRQGLAIEPMSCPPDAFNSGVGLIRLTPGDTHQWTFGITLSTTS